MGAVLTFAITSHCDFWRPPSVLVSQASSPRRLTTTVPHAVDRRHDLLTMLNHLLGEWFMFRDNFSDSQGFFPYRAGFNLVHG